MDVDDCVTTVLELEKAGLVDPKCVAIRGGLAGTSCSTNQDEELIWVGLDVGGFTVLAAAVKWTVHAAGKS